MESTKNRKVQDHFYVIGGEYAGQFACAICRRFRDDHYPDPQICEHCGNSDGPFRETFHSMTICVDSESCASRWQQQYGNV